MQPKYSRKCGGNQKLFFVHFVSTATVTKVYKDTSPTQVSSKLADFLKKNRVKKAEKTDKCEIDEFLIKC